MQILFLSLQGLKSASYTNVFNSAAPWSDIKKRHAKPQIVSFKDSCSLPKES